MIEIQEKEIGGETFKFNPMGAEKSREILVEIINRFGGSVSSGLENLGKADLKDVPPEANLTAMVGKLMGSIGGMIREITTNLDPPYYKKLLDEFGKRSEVKEEEGGQVRWPTMDAGYRDLFFSRRLVLEAKWLAWCMEVQYNDFFGLASTMTQNIVATKWIQDLQSKLSSPEGSTGTSTESQAPTNTTAPSSSSNPNGLSET